MHGSPPPPGGPLALAAQPSMKKTDGSAVSRRPGAHVSFDDAVTRIGSGDAYYMPASAPIEEDEETRAAALARLADHFPALAPADIASALDRCGGDVVMAERQLQNLAWKKGLIKDDDEVGFVVCGLLEQWFWRVSVLSCVPSAVYQAVPPAVAANSSPPVNTSRHHRSPRDRPASASSGAPAACPPRRLPGWQR